MKKLILLLLAGSVFTLNSCTKSGPQGPAGADGNANVIGINRVVTVSSWTLTGTTYSATFPDPNITSDIVSNGVVEVYKAYGTNEWTNLPDINGITSTVFDFYVGGFTIYIQNSDGTTPANPGTISFRDVIISASQRQAHPNTNWKNYNEANAAINATPASSQVNINVAH